MQTFSCGLLEAPLDEARAAHYDRGMSDDFRKALETFENQYPNRDYVIESVCPEFTSICPKTGQPDFGVLTITYVPDRLCIELKSLKMYINAFRSLKIFHEHVVNRILEDFVRACDPLALDIEGDFNVRGNIKTVIRAAYRKEGSER